MSQERYLSTPARVRIGLAVLALALDVACVTLFAALGRSEHERAATFAGLYETAWPFVAGLAVAWLVAFIWRRPLGVLRAGVPAWMGAAGIGMLFRMWAGQGTALPFVLVATGTLFVFLVGWRAVVALTRRVRRTR